VVADGVAADERVQWVWSVCGSAAKPDWVVGKSGLSRLEIEEAAWEQQGAGYLVSFVAAVPPALRLGET